jgi:ribose 5-phosphate isomerase RpiB
MKVAIATDHGGFVLKEELVARLREAGYEVVVSALTRAKPTMITPTT